MSEDRVWLEVDLRHLKSNVVALKQWQGKAICAVVKADAYGLGVANVAEAIYDTVDAYGVATVDEGVRLRQTIKDKSIFVLGKMFVDEIALAISCDLTMTIDTLNEAVEVGIEAKKQCKIAMAQLSVDTGMSRLGIRFGSDFFESAKEILAIDNINIVGVMSHYADSDNDCPLTFDQTSKFLKVKLGLEKIGYNIKNYHICNSGGAINHNADFCNMTRIGIAMYGVCQRACASVRTDCFRSNFEYNDCNRKNSNTYNCKKSDACHSGQSIDEDNAIDFDTSQTIDIADKLKGVASLWSKIVKIYYLPKGQGVSYGHTFVAQRNMRIAVVACGYADGYPLAASNRAFAMVEGQCARVVGKVCMDMLMLDISDIVGVEVGAKVLLWQCDKDSPVPLKKLATMVASSQYELLTRIGNRVKRVYIQ